MREQELPTTHRPAAARGLDELAPSIVEYPGAPAGGCRSTTPDAGPDPSDRRGPSRAAETDERARPAPPSGRWMRQTRFRRANALVALASSAAVLIGAGTYLASTADRPNRPLIWGLLALSNLVGAIVVVVSKRWRPSRPLMHAWTAAAILIVVGGVAADGGLASPLVAILFVPLGVTAMALRPRAMAGHCVLAVGGLTVAGYGTDTLSIGLLAIWAMCLVSLVVVGLGVAHNTRTLTREIEAANDHLRELSRRDPLTGCLNHRSFHEEVERELARAARAETPASLLLLDIDRFKQVNDTYGHPAGDAVLIAVAEALQVSTRAGDVVARTGGEEFSILLPDTPGGTARQIGERVRVAVANAAGPAPVTVSAGLATFPEHGRTSTRLIHLADRALYAAKDAGRDRLRVAATS